MCKRWLPGILGLLLLVGLSSEVTAQESETEAEIEPTLEDLIETERLPELRVNSYSNTAVRDHFRVAPARNVLRLNPGQSAIVEFNIFNLQGKTVRYLISTEDFNVTAADSNEIKFYGTETEGPYPARLWIKPEVREIILRHGERAYLTATIIVPFEAEPGDHQAALMIQDTSSEQAGGGFKVTSRVATQFLITVNGAITEDATPQSLSTTKYVNWHTPINFSLDMKNDGTIHVAPEGIIRIRNIFNTIIGEVPVQDWILLRNSHVSRQFSWQPNFALGLYKATAELKLVSSLGESQTVPVSTSFWIVPLIPLVILVLIILLLSFGLQYFFSQFELKKK